VTDLHCRVMSRSKDDEPRLSRADLAVPFLTAEKPTNLHRVGVEAEKFGFLLPDYAPLPYDGERSVTALLKGLVSRGFREEREKAEGPIIALKRGQCSITLEPGAQVELSGSPHFDLHAVSSEIEKHYLDLAELSGPLGIVFCSTGYHPFATETSLPWVPKLRYAIMKEYLPRLGNGALEMMQRTATVQVNFDYCCERDALRKLRLLLKLGPIVHAITANSPIKEGKLTDTQSLRGDVWTRMDPSRSGLIEKIFESKDSGYEDYIEWALDAGMFLFKRNGEVIANTGQTFRDFLRRGYLGHYATLSDWNLHLGTLFPEVRLKNTLELRSCDAQPTETQMAIPALGVGILYDDIAFAQAEDLASLYNFAQLSAARPELIKTGYGTLIAGQSLEQLAYALVEIARGGLNRRAKLNAEGKDESIYLDPLAELVERRKTPSALLRDRLIAAPRIDPKTIDPKTIVDLTRII
jgi:glutamate--cysteine ligase